MIYLRSEGIACPKSLYMLKCCFTHRRRSLVTEFFPAKFLEMKTHTDFVHRIILLRRYLCASGRAIFKFWIIISAKDTKSFRFAAENTCGHVSNANTICNASSCSCIIITLPKGSRTTLNFYMRKQSSADYQEQHKTAPIPSIIFSPNRNEIVTHSNLSHTRKQNTTCMSLSMLPSSCKL